MKASPEIQALVGCFFIVYALIAFFAAIWRPKLLDHALMRPRWWGFGPRATRAAVAFGSGFWSTVGVWLLGGALGILPADANKSAFWLLIVFFIAAGLAQLVASDDEET